VELNRWSHFAGTWDGNKVRLYINGELDSEFDWTHGINSSGARLYIGVNPGGGDEYFSGMIDEVRIWRVALTKEEIRANMYARLTGDEPNLVGYWDFDEGEGQDVCDLSGNGNDGSVVGATWVDSDAPVGICTKPELVERNITDALESKQKALEEIAAALAKENATVNILGELFRGREYSELNKSEIVSIRQNVHTAIQEEEQSERALGKSVIKLEDSLSIMDNEAEPAGTNNRGGRK
jgi:hypothetical protein